MTLHIPLKPIVSSQLAEHGYDEASRTLAIRFQRSDKVYHYANVPPEIPTGLAGAESAGKFFGTHIRGKFEHTVKTQPAEHAATT